MNLSICYIYLFLTQINGEDVWMFWIRCFQVSNTKASCVIFCCREQRVTHILIFLMIGLSVVLTPVLGHIPMPVLFGVFLYMGVASLKGLQFFDRLLIIFMPVKYQPDHMFLRQVSWIWNVCGCLLGYDVMWICRCVPTSQRNSGTHLQVSWVSQPRRWLWTYSPHENLISLMNFRWLYRIYCWSRIVIF